MNGPSKEPVRVTDHAVLRYLERAMGLKIETVREHILQLCVAPAAFGAVCVRAEGLRFVITDGVVVTVTPDHQPLRKFVQDQPAYLKAAEASV
jgi:hypothetical protein